MWQWEGAWGALWAGREAGAAPEIPPHRRGKRILEKEGGSQGLEVAKMRRCWSKGRQFQFNSTENMKGK